MNASLEGLAARPAPAGIRSRVWLAGALFCVALAVDVLFFDPGQGHRVYSL